ncbi:hypothetical protein UA32_06620 [Photobacterium angustum]|uniref:Nitrate/nitrite sensing protein domain-containing protein n=2 Tax=Photobacterium angustum TaxID=661 RepID=A0ABX5H6V6_PHOAN|nr:hypothetical protein [Photobacterium angustum]KJG38930.1 hypothetical protein UA32_06620 [Photobacterium angustum]PSX11695.1 hypothetical protein C0W27_04810 [Photobacterium angustum]
MWLIIAIVISLLTIGYITWKTKKNNIQLQLQFDQIIQLRQLIQFIRYHRRYCHQKIVSNNTNNKPHESIQNKRYASKQTLSILIHQADTNHKPMYRILRQEIQRLFTDSPNYSLQRSQAVHGRIIRHIMYLIDDVISASLLTAEKDTTFEHYQSAWPVTLNALDSLNKFRWTIEQHPLENKSYAQELEMHVKMIQRRLGQISMISHQTPPIWPIEKLMQTFQEIQFHNQDENKLKEELYLYSIQISDTIFQFFDLIINDIADDLAITGPNITACAIDFSHNKQT